MNPPPAENRNVPFARPWITDADRAAVLEVLSGHVLTHGPQGEAFEAEFRAFVGGGHAVALSSCMAALHLAYVDMGIGPGDEVLVPAETHTATAHAVELVGARPVFVDCDPRTGNVTAEALGAAVTPATKALSVVHFLGAPCDMPGIMRVAERHGLKVVEDCAIALGSRVDGKHVGLWGDVGTFSFYPVKHITTGEGGVFLTKHDDVAARVKKLRAFGVDRSHAERAIPGSYDVLSVGYNYRMSEMAAALGRSQLRRIGEILAARKANFARLADALRGVPRVTVLSDEDPSHAHSHYALTAVLDGPAGARRDDVVKRMNALGVGTSIYYPQPVPRMTYYRTRYGYDAARFPGAERISDRSVALPVGPHLTNEDVDHVAASLRLAIKEVGA